MIEINKIHNLNCYLGLKNLPDKSVNCIVTSPPYFGLRNYGTDHQVWPEVNYTILGFDITVPIMDCSLGLEKSPMEFVGHIVEIFRECRRVLKDDGTLWLNLGDSYNSALSNQNSRKEMGSTINDVKYYTNEDEKLGRKKLFELNPEYIKIAEERLYKELGMFL